MSEADPSSLMDQLDGMCGIHDILKDIDKCNDQDVTSKLMALLNMLSTAERSKDFQTFDGPKKILHLIDNKNKKIAKLTFLILGQYASRTDKGMNSSMLNMQLFSTLSKTLEDIDSLSYNFVQSALFLLSSVIALDKMGQTLARKSKCLHHLIVLFLRILPSLLRNENWEEDRAIRESKGHRETWKLLCLSIKESIYNPQDKVNQQQVNTIIPKSIVFLNDWIQYAKENDPLEEFVLSLISLLVQILSHNTLNQSSFAAYSGITTLIKGLNKLQGFTNSSRSEVINKMIRLLNAAVSGHKDNCLLTISLGGMDLLLQLLKIFPANKKFPVIVTLAHLVHKGDANDEKFVKAEGLSILAIATVNVGTDPAERQAASKLLKSWAAKVSFYNNQQMKSVKNDQLFRDNALLKLKPSFAENHQEIHDECATDICHNGSHIEGTSLKEVKQDCIDSQWAPPNKKSEVKTQEVLPVCSDSIGMHKMNGNNMLNPANHLTSTVGPMEIQAIVIAQNKDEDIDPEDHFENMETIHPGRKDIKKDSEKVDPTSQINKDCSLIVQIDRSEMNKENWPHQNTIKYINRKTNQNQISPVLSNSPCVNDATLCLYNGSVHQCGQQYISSSHSHSENPHEHSKYIPCPNKQICQENLNISSESEYASALDTSFASNPSFSSCYAASNVSTPKISDETLNTRDDYIDSSEESMVTMCPSQNNLAEIMNNSCNSSDSSFDDQSTSYKRSRGRYEHFSRRINPYLDFECQNVRHSTPKVKKPKLDKKLFTRRNKQRILSYHDVTLPASHAGFSAVKLNSSITSSSKSSVFKLSPEEIDYLEVGAARFGKNFKAIMDSSLSTNE